MVIQIYRSGYHGFGQHKNSFGTVSFMVVTRQFWPIVLHSVMMMFMLEFRGNKDGHLSSDARFSPQFSAHQTSASARSAGTASISSMVGSIHHLCISLPSLGLTNS